MNGKKDAISAPAKIIRNREYSVCPALLFLIVAIVLEVSPLHLPGQTQTSSAAQEIRNPGHAEQTSPAEPSVVAANSAVLSQMPFSDRQDFEDANRGFIATTPNTPDLYKFLQQDAPPTVNPALWRQAQLNVINGLFKVTDGIYQVRGFSQANMTIVEGKTGIIVIDTLTTPGAAREALNLYFEHRLRRPIVAVIYTHSHPDHFGGASGIVSPADAAAGKTKVIAPVGFMEAITTEGVVAGNLSARRAQYQFGVSLPRGERGFVDNGEGENESRGEPGAGPIVPPNEIIRQPIETRTIDGVEFIFQLALDSEAPSEMLIYLPQSHVLDVAEDATHTLHNLLPLRGSVVRDANRWSQYLNIALDQFGAEAQIVIDQHTWPVWGNERVRTYLANYRDLYKYVHDQTVRMMNQGLGPAEIAEALTLPPGLEKDWSVHGYYGTLSQDSRAVYQRYIGWYDGNPATLNRLPRVEEAKKYLEYMGGSAAVISRAREDFKAGHYRWVAEVMDQVVFADPSNKEARNLAADAFEQLGYLAESATWRNAYLLGAQELRNGVRPGAGPVPAVGAQILHTMPIAQVFDYLGTCIDGPRAGTANIVINWRFTDTSESLMSTLEHGALTSVAGRTSPNAVATVTTTRPVFESIVLGKRTLRDAIEHGDIMTSGDARAISDLWALLVEFRPDFPVVGPA
jgi:alkyl sulfatase BDS1-like metallo-beta-lactamase superfamily hydrolase